MRVVLIAGGASVHTVKWLNGLQAEGLDVHLITQHPVLKSIGKNVHVHSFPFRGAVGYFSMIPAVRALLATIRPDIVNAHYASGYATTARFSAFRPWLLSVWGSDVYEFPYRSRFHKAWVCANLRAADAIASTSHCMARQVRRIEPNIKDLNITPFGVDIEAFDGQLKRVDPESRSTPLVIGTVKAMNPLYGIDTLIHAFSLVFDRLKNSDIPDDGIRLRLVGEGGQRDELMALAARLGVGEYVEFVGRVEHHQVPAELKCMDIFIALSRQESFGVAAIEAGAASLPVVVSDADGLVEVVINGVTGLVVPRDDPAAAADAIFLLIRDRALRLSLAANGRHHVETNYAWPQSVSTMVKVFEKTIFEFKANSK